MRFAASAFALCGLAFVAVACPPSTPRPAVPFSLQLATRQSCGVFSGLDYDTGCLAAVYVKVLNEERAVLFEQCQRIEPRAVDLRDLLNRDEPIISIDGLSAKGVVTFDVRGFHDVGAPADIVNPCNQPNNNATWLFWGVSDPVDLADYDDGEGPSLIRIVLDCRDCSVGFGENEVFGCVGIRADAGPTDTCGPGFPSSFCVPVLTCEKACDSDDECFEGARRCIDDTCDIATRTGELCSPCGGAVACGEDFRCVGRPGEPSFCAPSCPGVEPCPAGTMCNRLRNDLDPR